MYAQDAMYGLELANRLVKPGEQEVMVEELQESRAKKALVRERKPQRQTTAILPERSKISLDVPIYKPADLQRHILRDYQLSHIEPN